MSKARTAVVMPNETGFTEDYNSENKYQPWPDVIVTSHITGAGDAKPVS